MRFSRILTCSAIVAMGSMLAWGARPTSAPLSTAAVAVQGQGRGMNMTPDQQADNMINRLKSAQTNPLSDADATAAKTPLVTYYTAYAKLRSDAGQGNPPDATKVQEARDQLSKDLKAANVSDGGVTAIVAGVSAARGRRGGGGN